MKFMAKNLALIGLILMSGLASAKDEAREDLQAKLCEGMLGHTLVSNAPLTFDLMKGLALRGFLGSYPEVTPTTIMQASSQGAMYWAHAIGVQPNIMAAANHDSKFDSLSKILYFISPVDVSDLKDETDLSVIQKRFQQISASAELVYFDDLGGQQVVRGVPKDVARRLIHPEAMRWYSKDDRGPRFLQGGWTFPKIRGILTYENVFQSNSNTIKNILKLARSLEKKGYTFTFNGDFQQALNKARDQVRIEKQEDGTLKAVSDGSRYREEVEYSAALAMYKAGHGVSVEVRDASGRMVAGVLGQHNGNVWAFDTIFYDFSTRDGSRIYSPEELAAMPDAREAKSLIDLAKVAVVAGLLRIHDHGIDVSDAGMVTKFTASMKGYYVPAEEFLQRTGELRSRPPIKVDLTTPFSFSARPE